MKERVNPPKYTPNVGSTNNGDDQRTREYTDIDGHTSKNESRAFEMIRPYENPALNKCSLS
jgi:hypothetical protein